MNIKKLFCVLFITVMLLSVPCAYALDSDTNDDVKEVQDDVKDVGYGDFDNELPKQLDSVSINPTFTKEPNKFIESTITLSCKVGAECGVTEENKVKNTFEVSKSKYDKLIEIYRNTDPSKRKSCPTLLLSASIIIKKINDALKNKNYNLANNELKTLNSVLLAIEKNLQYSR